MTRTMAPPRRQAPAGALPIRSAAGVNLLPPYATRNDLPETARGEMTGLLNQRLADCIALQTLCKPALWFVEAHQQGRP